MSKGKCSSCGQELVQVRTWRFAVCVNPNCTNWPVRNFIDETLVKRRPMKVVCKRGHVYRVSAKRAKREGIKDESGRYILPCDECEMEDELEMEMRMDGVLNGEET